MSSSNIQNGKKNICPNQICGYSNEIGDKFCANCGNALIQPKTKEFIDEKNDPNADNRIDIDGGKAGEKGMPSAIEGDAGYAKVRQNVDDHSNRHHHQDDHSSYRVSSDDHSSQNFRIDNHSQSQHTGDEIKDGSKKQTYHGDVLGDGAKKETIYGDSFGNGSTKQSFGGDSIGAGGAKIVYKGEGRSTSLFFVSVIAIIAIVAIVAVIFIFQKSPSVTSNQNSQPGLPPRTATPTPDKQVEDSTQNVQPKSERVAAPKGIIEEPKKQVSEIDPKESKIIIEDETDAAGITKKGNIPSGNYSLIVIASGTAMTDNYVSKKALTDAAVVDAKLKAKEIAINYMLTSGLTGDENVQKVLENSFENASVNLLEVLDDSIEKNMSGRESYNITIRAEVIPALDLFEASKALDAAWDNPAAPLAAKVWTDKKQYKQLDSIKVYFRSNKPCYAYIIYQDVSGDIFQLLPNRYRTKNYFSAGSIYEIPSNQDQFELKVSQPFGEERISVFACTKPLGRINIMDIGGIYRVETPPQDILSKVKAVDIMADSTNREAVAEFFKTHTLLSTEE